jgi:O-antigen ligase
MLGVFSALCLALWQRHMQGNFRPDGFMTSAIPFGNLSLMAGILCLSGITWANTQYRYAWVWKVALYTGFLAGLYASLLSGSRGGWLAIPVVLAIFLVAFLKRDRLKAMAFSTVLLITAITLAGIGMQDQITARYDAAVMEAQDYASNGNASTSVGIRLEAWRTAMANIAEKPILGWSYNDYDARLQELAAEKKADASITALANTHNNFLEVWLHQGLLGLLSLLALFIVPFWFFCKRLRSDDHTVQAFALGGACLLACFFVFGLTQVILGRNNGVIFFGLTLVIFWACMRNAEQRAAAMLPSQ